MTLIQFNLSCSRYMKHNRTDACNTWITHFLRRTDTTSKTPAKVDVTSDVQQHSFVATFVENT